MSNLQDIKEKKFKIMLGTTEEEIKFDFNAFALLEDIYNSVQDMFNVIEKGSIKGIRNLIWAGMSHKYMDEVTEEMSISKVAIGKLLDLSMLPAIQEALGTALTAAVPQADKELTEEELNSDKQIETEMNDLKGK